MSDQPPTALQAPSDRSTRPSVVGSDSGPSSPFPIYLEGTVQRGFGRGGKDLGCPTANLPAKVLAQSSINDAPTGVYFGYARILSETEGGRGEEYQDKERNGDEPSRSSRQQELTKEDYNVYPMVMSLGWNPFFANKTKTAEVHIMHPFKTDFYGLHIKTIVLGYIRPEYNYVDVDALIKDIETDKTVALNSLQRQAYTPFISDSFFTSAAKHTNL
ncbi:unnamed protein product [Sympodiomycopsis kandeliae]